MGIWPLRKITLSDGRMTLVLNRRARLKEAEERIWSARRCGIPERAETREDFELERVVSCRGCEWRGRTKLDFGSGEPFDDLHRSTTLRAAPKVV
jgi:hypothetical protein